MLGIVKNNKIIPLTTDTGTGASVGTLIQQYKKVPISGYLYCDGSTFDQNVYPALYMYLGSNVLPDYRECVMVGAEENTTNTIAAHDVYGEGEFKDDQIQSHRHLVKDTMFGSPLAFDMGAGNSAGVTDRMVTGVLTNRAWEASGAGYQDTVSRYGNTTHGKQKAVYVYIKATSGLMENQQDNVLNDVKNYVDNSNSYSTQEVKTGGKWIDGKPIYRKVLIAKTFINGDEWGWGGLESDVTGLNIDSCLRCFAITVGDGSRHLQFSQAKGGFISYKSGISVGSKIIMEYTKTTD